MRRVSLGAIVDMSTIIRPSWAPPTAPLSPRSTFSTWAPSTTIENTTSLDAATCAAESATVAPCSPAQASAVSRVRL